MANKIKESFSAQFEQAVADGRITLPTNGSGNLDVIPSGQFSLLTDSWLIQPGAEGLFLAIADTNYYPFDGGVTGFRIPGISDNNWYSAIWGLTSGDNIVINCVIKDDTDSNGASGMVGALDPINGRTVTTVAALGISGLPENDSVQILAKSNGTAGDGSYIFLSSTAIASPAEIRLEMSGVGTNNLKIEGLPEYVNDAAADADANLANESLYKITGDRTVYQKP